MKILLLSATEFEINTFLNTSINKDKIDVLIGGVGMASTILNLTKRLISNKYDLVLQAGIAGVFNNKNIELGDVVMVKQDAFGDLGAMEKNNFQSIQEMKFNDGNEWLINENELQKQFKYPLVKAITVNTITDNEAVINALQNKWNADVESMEGAALHYVCGQLNIPYLQIRSISNAVGERDKTKWQFKKAIDHLNLELDSIIAQLSI